MFAMDINAKCAAVQLRDSDLDQLNQFFVQCGLAVDLGVVLDDGLVDVGGQIRWVKSSLRHGISCQWEKGWGVLVSTPVLALGFAIVLAGSAFFELP